jgi:hypothetical protein
VRFGGTGTPGTPLVVVVACAFDPDGETVNRSAESAISRDGI